MQKEINILISSEVTWGLYENERKTGKVIGFIENGKSAFRVLHLKTGETQLKHCTQSRIKFGGSYSQNDRYLVAVKRRGSEVIDYYAPTVGMVKSYMSKNQG